MNIEKMMEHLLEKGNDREDACQKMVVHIERTTAKLEAFI
jgi:hypothetical protein